MDYRTLTDEALLRASDIHRQHGPVPYGHTMWWQLVARGEAPQPAMRRGRVTAWRWGDIRAYLDWLARGRAHYDAGTPPRTWAVNQKRANVNKEI